MTTPFGGLQIPDDCMAQLRSAKAAGQTVFQKMHAHGDCQNCGGTRYLYFQFVLSGPNEYANPRPHMISIWMDDAWHVVDTRAYACPMCNADQPARIQMLFESSGLLLSERSWRMDYIAGLEGKVDAVAAARLLLAETTRPTGWTIFYGDYGRGKSGLLKSLVASAIRIGIAARYIRANDILAEIGATYSASRGGETERDITALYDDWPLLCVDEIDRIGGSDWSQSKLMALLDRRYDRRDTHATVIATNRNPRSMGEMWEYLTSRMRDAQRVPIGGIDMRGMKRENRS